MLALIPLQQNALIFPDPSIPLKSVVSLLESADNVCLYDKTSVVYFPWAIVSHLHAEDAQHCGYKLVNLSKRKLHIHLVSKLQGDILSREDLRSCPHTVESPHRN
jgi:hypothetical protein